MHAWFAANYYGVIDLLFTLAVLINMYLLRNNVRPP